MGLAPHHCSWKIQSGMLMNHVHTVPCSTLLSRSRCTTRVCCGFVLPVVLYTRRPAGAACTRERGSVGR